MDEQTKNVAHGNSEVNYVTTVLTKIIEGLDALEVTPDGQSLNLWRRQCAWALGLLGTLKAKRLKEVGDDGNDDPLLKEIDRLLAEWEPNKDGFISLTSFENTTIEALDASEPGDRRVRMYFDSYEDNCFREDVQIHLEHMEREKHNRICDRLSNWFGRAWKVIMQSGLIELSQEIVSPIEGRYTDRKMQFDSSRRRQPSRQANEATSRR